MNTLDVEKVIAQLQLEPLDIEGGFFHETYRSKTAAANHGRSCGTCIYYLLRGNDFSAWHKVESDEIWLYHAGVPARQAIIAPDGSWTERIIGADIAAGHVPQSIIPAGHWQTAVPLDRNPQTWGLFSAVVFPSFEYADFTAATNEQMHTSFPALTAKIKNFRGQ